MRIVLDAMGSDTYPEPEIQAAVEAGRTYGDEVILVGHEERLRPRLQALAGENPPVRIVHAPEVLEMGDKPAANARRKAQNSMAIGMDLIKEGQADAFITAGNTGGAMANALFHLGRIRGVKRPALTALFPVRQGHCVVLDIGANAECKPEYLLQFAIMGSLYAQKVLKIASPRVGLLSNGEEAGKGNELVKETYPLLQGSGLNFIGNVEGKELFGGHADVVVTDGFTGNVLLKSSEAVAKLITDILKEELTASARTKVGALLAKPAFGKIKKMLDPAEVGAAPLLGIDGLVFIGHGRSDARALLSAIRVARQAVEANLLEAVRSAIQVRLADIQTQESA
ncbi:MAG: phosphate acyltransferase PlsX [Chloroflexota bacterium]|nr:MAG: phosphate acyltransferase PlsX [Chloroflexota bacterium]